MSEKDVKFYTTSTCPWCLKAKNYLIEKGIQFTEIDVGEDKSKLQEMINVSGQRGVPVITIDGEVVVGFNKEAFDSLLGE